jgi:hypothetical protein
VQREHPDDQKRFFEEMILRFERAFQGVARVLDSQETALERMKQRLDASILEMEEHRREFQEHRRELREEYEAQRGTLLAILDRLDLIDPRDGPPHPSMG